MNRRKRKSTPVIFGGKVSDETLLMQRQIEEPEPEEQGFGWLINRRTVDNAIQPTGRRSKGSSGAYAPLNHEHPTALIPTSHPQEPVENELRFDGGGFLRRWDGTSWELVPPLPSNTAPQPTGVSQVGSSLDYSRADHSHPTAILTQGNSQTPVSNEIRYNTNNELVRWNGSNWVAFKVDASNILNLPPSTITVRKNSGSNIGTRPRLNFIEGNNITLTISDDPTDNEIDITIEATGGGGGNPYNNTPQPTGLASAGTSTDYSRGDHSHATALIAQSNAQTPVERELRYNTSDALVMRVGTSWVPVKVDWGDVLNPPSIPSPSNTIPQPTGGAAAGTSANYSRADHSHATALIEQSNAQTPAERELRYTTSNTLVMRVGSNWVPVKVDWGDVLNQPSIPSPSNATPQPTGVAAAGSSTQYSRADHSHPTALLTEGDSQSPVQNELRFKTTNELVRWDGSSWVPIAVDAANVLNLPPSTITVRKNSGSDVGTRPRLNFIEGSNITITVADDSADNEIDITITSTAGGANPSNADPQPTGYVSAGTSTDYSRGDHSHPTAILAQSNSQTPVQNEIRFNTSNKLVRWDGSQWVELSVETGGNTPVQSTSNYSEQGTNDGEIWYRTNDRAFFFRVGGQRVYPAATLFTVSESATNTGAGNRILLIDSTANNLLRIGGTVNQTVFAYPKLPVISGGMSTNTNWNTGAGSSPVGALWVDTSQGNLPFIYYNSFTPEKFLVGRVRYYSGSMGTGAYASSEPDGILEMGEGGNLFTKASNLTYVYGYSNTFDFVFQAHKRIVSAGTVVANNLSTSAANVVDIFINNTLSYIYESYVELGDASDNPFFLFPMGFLKINSSIQSANFRFRVEMPYIRVSGSNAEEWAAGLLLIKVDSSTIRRAYFRIVSPSSSVVNSCGSGLMNWSALFTTTQFGTANWEYYENGTYINNTTSVPTGNYQVLFYLRRTRGNETSPRSTTRHRYITVMTTLPINRMWFE